jgi:hypothetical protein
MQKCNFFGLNRLCSMMDFSTIGLNAAIISAMRFLPTGFWLVLGAAFFDLAVFAVLATGVFFDVVMACRSCLAVVPAE